MRPIILWGKARERRESRKEKTRGKKGEADSWTRERESAARWAPISGFPVMSVTRRWLNYGSRRTEGYHFLPNPNNMPFKSGTSLFRLSPFPPLFLVLRRTFDSFIFVFLFVSLRADRARPAEKRKKEKDLSHRDKHAHCFPFLFLPFVRDLFLL